MTKKFFIKKLFSSSEKTKNCESGNEVTEGPAEFETAVSALGFGKFNILMFLVLIPSQWAMIFDTTLMSYISPVAQCDLDLSLNNKGTINAVAPFGAIVGGVFWGILIDTLGRKKLIMYGFFIEGIITIVTSLTQNFAFLLISKLISGAMTGGLYIAQCTYYAEFHSMEHRGKMQLSMGFIAGAGQVAMPVLSSFFLPLDFTVTPFNGYIKFHSWNLLILISSILSFTAGTVFIFLPESPKYLMTKGNNEEALTVFRKVYRINKGQPEDSYPIKKLINETIESKYTGNGRKAIVINYIKNGWHQVAPLLNKIYFPKLLLVTTIELIIITNINTLRLWLPQIFQSIHEYQADHNGMTAQLCTMLETLKTVTNSSQAAVPECNVNTENNLSVYINSIVIAIVGMVGYALAGTFMNMIPKKKLLCVLGVVSGITILTTYLSQNTITTLTLTSLHLATTGISFDVVMTIIVVIFPTTLRATAISIVLMIGRTGAILGNVLFPVLLQTGCAIPFFTLGGIAFAGTFACWLLPVTDNNSLK
ncbi:synaptic vesicle glycoprotein 2B [Anoplophora glabripennis]|uniref:synaptic vesicle glycoprotein 2B n=1 Tax=Anoplophora glabripennis TaxID=217634 RepID=UPI000873CE9F|nr:synaptic vesicle glycoprotein 2B [Anoplophora glabripennis]